MKSFIKIALAATLALPVMVACSNEEDNLFDQSSADRLNSAVKEYAQLLQAAPNGWAMQYFTNDNEPGYTYIMRFDPSMAVTIGGNNQWLGNKYAEETSVYKFITDNGPVLSLSSFNNVFHILADPIDVPTTSESELGYGHKGDYEFVVMEAAPDCVRLKGKKYGQKIIMTPLEADVDWQTYLNDLTILKNSMFNTRFEPLLLKNDKLNYSVTGMNTGVMNLVAEGDDALTQTQTVNFIVTSTGIRCSKTWTSKDDLFKINEFERLADGSLRLIQPEGEEVVITSRPLSEIYSTPGFTWRIDLDNTTGTFATLLSKIGDDTKSALKRNFTGIDFSYVSSGVPEPTYALSFRMSGSSAAAYVYGNVTATGDNTVKIAYSTTEGNNNGVRRLADIPGLIPFINAVASTEFTIETENVLSPSTIRLVSKSNPADVIVVKIA